MKAKEIKFVKQTIKSTPYILHEVRLTYSSLSRDIPMVTKIKCSKDVYDIMINCFEEQINVREMFFLMCLDRANNIKCISQISMGGISGTVTDVRLIYCTALLTLSSGIIICHNHPSGNIQPSESDSRITQKIKEAGQTMDIQLLDHLIINGTLTESEDKYYSFADNGLI